METILLLCGFITVIIYLHELRNELKNMNRMLAMRNEEQSFDMEELFDKDIKDDEKDDLYEEAKRITMENDTISTSILQRKLKTGYVRTAHLIDEMEKEGIIGGIDGANPRKVLKKL